MLKAYLKEKNVPFTEKVIDQDTAAQEEMAKLSGGFMGVPFTTIKNGDNLVKITGFDKPKIDEALGLKG